jgi:hypothetical protein
MAAAVFVTLVALAGCGGSESSSTETVTVQSGETLSKAEFVEKADAICADWKPEREALQEQAEELIGGINAGSDDARAELSELLSEATENAEQELSEIRQLSPPPADASTIDSMLSTAGVQVALTREESDALRYREFAAFGSVTRRAGAAKAKASALARSYGLKVCGTE